MMRVQGDGGETKSYLLAMRDGSPLISRVENDVESRVATGQDRRQTRQQVEQV